MEATRPLYMMLSQTNTGIGKAIRLLTRFEYNHVSLSLDPDFRRWVSFARYAKGVPLAGGFVTESPERYLYGEGPIPVKIFRIDIPRTRHKKLRALFSQAGQSGSGLIYNTFGALTTPMGVHLEISGAYTCLEFADVVLNESHRSIKSLAADHVAELIFEGDLRDLVDDNGKRSDRFFTRRGLLRGTMDTTHHFARLCGRMALRKRPDIVFSTLY